MQREHNIRKKEKTGRVQLGVVRDMEEEKQCVILEVTEMERDKELSTSAKVGKQRD